MVEWPIFYLVECPKLPSSIAHGFVSGSGSLQGSLYKLSCERGYSLIGVDTLVCTDTGEWSDSFPTCLIGNYFNISLLFLCFTHATFLVNEELEQNQLCLWPTRACILLDLIPVFISSFDWFNEVNC